MREAILIELYGNAKSISGIRLYTLYEKDLIKYIESKGTTFDTILQQATEYIGCDVEFAVQYKIPLDLDKEFTIIAFFGKDMDNDYGFVYNIDIPLYSEVAYIDERLVSSTHSWYIKLK